MARSELWFRSTILFYFRIGSVSTEAVPRWFAVLNGRLKTAQLISLILLREQQLSTVTISAQDRWDKRSAVNVKPELYLTTS